MTKRGSTTSRRVAPFLLPAQRSVNFVSGRGGGWYVRWGATTPAVMWSCEVLGIACVQSVLGRYLVSYPDSIRYVAGYVAGYAAGYAAGSVYGL